MEEHNYHWPYERTTQPSLAEILEQLQEQVAPVSRFVDTLDGQSIPNAYCREQADYAPSYYHPDWQSHPSFSWDNNQDQFYDPNPSYLLEFSHSPPPQPEDTSKLEETFSKFLEQQEERRVEELLTKFISQNEVRMTIQDASIRNLEIQMAQLVDAIVIHPQSTLPSNTKINPKEEGEEQCMVNTHGCSKELHEAIGGDCLMIHSTVEVNSKVSEMRSVNGFNAKEEEDQEVAVKGVKVIEYPRVHEECFQLDLIKSAIKDNADEESFFSPIDEVKCGGRQSCKNVIQIKEKTTRRHDMQNFAIHPD